MGRAPRSVWQRRNSRSALLSLCCRRDRWWSFRLTIGPSGGLADVRYFDGNRDALPNHVKYRSCISDCSVVLSSSF